MITVVEVKKNANESGTNLIRRFTRKVQETGIIQKVKGNRYAERPASKLTVKKATLKRLVRRKEHEKLLKLGKAVKIVRGRRR